MFRTLLWLSAIALAIGYGIYAFATVDRRSDEAQIRSLVVTTTKAIDSQDLGGTVACLSQNYKGDDGLNYDRLRVLIAQAMRAHPQYTAQSKLKSLEITGNEAVMQVDLTVHTQQGGDIYKPNMTIHLAKEPTRHMGIVPTRVWRVVKVERLGLQAPTF